MSPFFSPKPRGLLAVLALSPALWLASTVSAQTAPPTAQPADTFRSALEGYQPYTEEKTINWKEANDLTGRIGGWRVYAKEAQQPAAAGSPPAPPPADPHAGHGKPPQAKP